MAVEDPADPADSALEAAPLPEQALVGGRYRITGTLGEGGMARVYRAHDEVLGRDVALKMLAPGLADDPAYVERFKREAQLVGSLADEHVVPLFDAGFADDQPFLVFQLVEGVTLRELLHQRQKLPPAEAARIAADLAAALEAAHARGIVHGDVKPLNVLIERRQDQLGAVRLADFGVARPVDAESTLDGDGGRVVYGSVAYLAPEQLASPGTLAPSVDVYALGVVLYEMLLGRRPFEGTVEQIIARRAMADPPSPREIDPRVPPVLEAIVVRALVRQPERRYQDGAAFRRALLAFLDSPEPRSAEPDKKPSYPAVTSSERAAAQRLPRSHAAPPARSHSWPSGSGLQRFGIGRHNAWWLLAPVLLLVGVAAVAASRQSDGRGPSLPGGTTVPGLAGSTLADARAAAAAAGLALTVQEEPTLDTPAGVVVTQDPLAGQTTGRNATVQVVVSAGVTVPAIEGRQCPDARAELANRGWTVRPVRWRFANASDFGKIVSQEPAAGSVVPAKGDITVNVAGPVRPC